MKWWRGLLSSLEQLVEVAVCSAYHHTHSRMFHHQIDLGRRVMVTVFVENS
jgi:hypothetical protein